MYSLKVKTTDKQYIDVDSWMMDESTFLKSKLASLKKKSGSSKTDDAPLTVHCDAETFNKLREWCHFKKLNKDNNYEVDFFKDLFKKNQLKIIMMAAFELGIHGFVDNGNKVLSEMLKEKNDKKKKEKDDLA